MVLKWKVIKQERPFGDIHVGYLGKMPVCSIEEQGSMDDFSLTYALPNKKWRRWLEDERLRDRTFVRLSSAKACAEHTVAKWLEAASLKQAR